MLACVNCRFFQAGEDLDRCKAASALTRREDPVYGSIQTGVGPRRAREPDGACGPDAALFEPRPSWWAWDSNLLFHGALILLVIGWFTWLFFNHGRP